LEKEIENIKNKIKTKFDDYEIKIRMVMEDGKKEKDKKEYLENGVEITIVISKFNGLIEIVQKYWQIGSEGGLWWIEEIV